MSNTTNGVNAPKSAENYAYSITTNSSSKSMTMQDFLMLVVSELQNQDMYSSGSSGGGSNADYLTQMAQIASMQAMQELSASFMSSMAVNYMGKYVHAEAVTNKNERVTREGVVDRVNFNGGDVMVLVKDTWFKVNDIYEIETYKVSVDPEGNGDDENNNNGDGDPPEA